MNAHLIDKHLMVTRSRLLAKVNVKLQRHIFHEMAIFQGISVLQTHLVLLAFVGQSRPNRLFVSFSSTFHFNPRHLTNYHTIPHFDALKMDSCGKHCEKRRNCLLQAVPSSLIMALIFHFKCT